MLIKHMVMAARNILRNKRRTTLTLMSIIVGLVGVSLLDGFIHYSLWGLRETIIKNGLGHIQVAASQQYFDEGDMDPYPFMLKDYEKISKKLRSIPEVAHVIPVIHSAGVLSFQGHTETVMVSALPSNLSSKLLNFRTIIKGRDITDDDAHGVLLGSGLAKKLGVVPGKVISLITSTKGGSVNSIELEVLGISQSGITLVDDAALQMNLTAAQELMLSNEVPLLLVFLEKTEQTNAVMAQMNNTLLPRLAKKTNQPLVAKPWSELSDYYKQANTAYSMVLFVAKMVMLVVTIFVIANTMSMAVFERMREIGTLRAVGSTRWNIVSLFLFEGLIIGVIGGILGILIGIGFCELINLFGGINLPPQPGMTTPITILFKPEISSLMQSVFITVITAMLGAVTPALRAAKFRIANILRYV